MSATAAPPSTPTPPHLGPPVRAPADPPPAPGRRPRIWRLLLGCVLVVGLSAGATVVLIKGEIKTIAKDLRFHKAIKLPSGTLAPAGFGDTQTILLVGNDQRKHTTTTPVLPHSNEMLLVRIDPNKPYISMMSIPRELMVTIQCPTGPVTTRLNYALTCGGFPTLISTIHQLTGIRPNHVVEIDFGNFQTAVNEIGCVYSTIDRRYYNVNIGTPDTDYSNINLQPGYQKLCGSQALQFVSYRHGDTSLVRDARDQDFLLDVKKEYGPSLLGNIHKFERIFGQTVIVDKGLQSESGVEDLLGTLISSATLRVRQVQFNVTLQPTGSNPCNCDTATPQQIAASVHSFLVGSDNVPTHSTAVAAHAVQHPRGQASLPLVPSTSAGLQQAQASARGIAFPLEYPRVQDANGTAVAVSLRDYLIHTPNHGAYPAYVAVFSNGLLGQYYDVQGMTWLDAPMFTNADQTVTVAGRTYSLFYSGQHLMVVAWYEHGAVYWIHNTLTDSVENGELLAIAEQTRPIGVPGTPGAPVGGARDGRHGRVAAVVVPKRLTTGPKVTTGETIGAIGGVATLLAAPLLCFGLFRRRRRLAALRAELDALLTLEYQLQSSVPRAPVVSRGSGP
jgi:polyisoprenyl-teichoic acid--peptidoglycan teichoic acid transferase